MEDFKIRWKNKECGIYMLHGKTASEHIADLNVPPEPFEKNNTLPHILFWKIKLL